DHDAGGLVGDANGRVGRVDALPSWATGAEHVDAQVVVVDLHVNVFGLGQHQDTGCRRVNASLRFGDGHALHAMHTAFELQLGKGSFARLRCALGFDGDGDRFETAESSFGGVDDFRLPALVLGKALI